MEIRPYQNDPQLFLADLEKVSLDRLQGSGSSELDSLVKLIIDKGIKIEAKYDSGGSKVIIGDGELLKKLIASFLSAEADAAVKGGYLASRIENGIDSVKSLLLNTYEKDIQGNPTSKLKTNWELSEFMAAVHFKLPKNRLDNAVIDIFVSVMSGHDKKRLELRDELAALTAELKVYSVIQSEINAKLAADKNQTLYINDSKSFNLLDHKKYGFSDKATFENSAEYKLLSKMFPGLEEISIKDFLESHNKQSGAMSGLETSYEYNKDNNKLANFSTSVNDRVNPLNNTVQEKTTRLNDVSSRYNAAIEALNRFIQKYDSVMRNILGAI
ncbi:MULTISPECIES: virulence-associated V antigen [Photorhabdus]|uniref:Virulence factor n=1 Tax=Photorhabdus thracensis TaxID=230089 RepID=A0A0F7LKE8_9GAMM|nr:virulence-associated V antigen [Photorhabdus thracensis]AKH62331.1 virulence factor [Photorhabdus thracensis]MCC8420769.1 virulence factor [Photorhabdus thracensis]